MCTFTLSNPLQRPSVPYAYCQNFVTTFFSIHSQPWYVCCVTHIHTHICLLSYSPLLGCFWPYCPHSTETVQLVLLCLTRTYIYTRSFARTRIYKKVLEHAPILSHTYSVHTHTAYLTFHISAVMLLCYTAPHPSRGLQNNWWMVTPPGWSLHGWPYLINIFQHGALCLSNHRVENLMDTLDCHGMAFNTLLCDNAFPKTYRHVNLFLSFLSIGYIINLEGTILIDRSYPRYILIHLSSILWLGKAEKMSNRADLFLFNEVA